MKKHAGTIMVLCAMIAMYLLGICIGSQSHLEHTKLRMEMAEIENMLLKHDVELFERVKDLQDTDISILESAQMVARRVGELERRLPTTDSPGDGAMYYDGSDRALYVWDGDAWTLLLYGDSIE